MMSKEKESSSENVSYPSLKYSQVSITLGLILIITAMFVIWTSGKEIGRNDTTVNEELESDEVIFDSIFVSESIFRDTISKILFNRIAEFSFINDSNLRKKESERQELFQLLMLKSIESLDNKFSITIDITDKDLSKNNFLVKGWLYHVTGSVNKFKVQKLIESNVPISELNDFIKYGDFIKYEKSIQYKTQIIPIIIGAAIVFIIIISMLFYPYFKKKSHKSNKERQIVTAEEEAAGSKRAQSILERDKKVDALKLRILNNKINKLEKQINLFKTKDQTYYNLEEETVRFFDRSNQLYGRSSLLLILGILFSILGIVIFYIILPEFNEKDKDSYLINYIRPAFTLLFIQSIAWYLLRQYRVLIEDYKYFHKQYEKRANYLSVYNLYNQDEISEAKMFLSYTLLNDDFTGKLKDGEKTEFSEHVKQIDKNPMFLLLKELVKNVNPKKKNAKSNGEPVEEDEENIG